jgi:hypothetical protein
VIDAETLAETTGIRRAELHARWQRWREAERARIDG